MFYCTYCPYSTNRFFNLRTHYERKKTCKPIQSTIICKPIQNDTVICKPIQNDTPQFNCTTCSYTTNRLANLRTHHERKNKCAPSFSQPTKEHVNIPVSESITEPILDTVVHNPNQCKICNKILASKAYAKKHELSCTGLHILQCPICLKFCLDKAAKSSHRKKASCHPPLHPPVSLEKENETLKFTIETLKVTVDTLNERIETLTNKPKTKRGALTDIIKKQIAAEQKWHCSICNNMFDATYNVDHTIPLWNGGMDHRDNATALCVSCHAKKTQNEWILRATM